MSNRKITDMAALTAPESNDVLPIVDISEAAATDKNKKISIEELFRGVPNGTAAAPSVAFEGDEDSGIFLAGTNTVGITTGGTQRVTVDGSGNVTISGDLTVQGATTTVESTTVTIDDKNIELGSVASPSNTTADGGGITLKGASDKTITWVNSTGCWTFNQPTNFNDHVRIDSSGRLLVGMTTSTSSNLLQATSDASINLLTVGRGGNNNSQNTALGLGALGSNTSGTQNVAVGYEVLAANTTGSYNTAVGHHTLKVNTTGGSNVAIGGNRVLTSNTTGSQNVAIGYDTLRQNTTGDGNTAVGTFALETVTTQTRNTAVGHSALREGSGRFNTGVGHSAMASTHGDYNVACGYEALKINTGQNNIAIGFSTLIQNDGDYNIAAGYEALQENSSGDHNIAAGYKALTDNTTGSHNIAIGDEVLTANTTGHTNIGIGDEALFQQTTAIKNIGIGFQALYGTTTGDRNIAIGSDAGSAITTGENNVIIGRIAGTSTLSDTVIIAAGTNERLRIDSSGRLLVGTTTANGNMTVNMGTDKNISFTGGISEVGSVPALQATNTSGSSLASMGFRATDLRFATGSAERMRIDSSGKLGVGTSSPNALLEINSSTAGNEVQRIEGTYTGSGSVVLSNWRRAGGAVAANFEYHDSPIKMSFGTTTSHTLALKTANTDRLTIDSSGRITVGGTTVTDVNLLNIQGSGAASNIGLVLNDTNTAKIYGIQNGGSALKFFDYTANTERLRISSDGNVGIGTSSPSARLDVRRGDADGLIAELHQSGGYGINIKSSQSVATIQAEANQALTFETGSSATERLRIDSSGRVAIGTTTIADTATALVIKNSASGSEHTLLDIVCNTNETARVRFSEDGSSFPGEIKYDTLNNFLSFNTNSSERVRVDSSGNVLIGTTSVGGSSGISLRSNGHFIAPVCYSVGLSASPRDAFIDSNGELGYVPSIRKAKTNIQVQSNVDWLYQLEPVTFNYKTKDRETGNYTDKAEAELEYGLIAEDVETACPDLCFYDQTDNGPELRGVSYKKLITPILKALQDAKAEIETLKTKVAALEAG